MADGVQAGTINTVNDTPTSPPPLIKVASGSWPQWAMTEILQCRWKEQTTEGSPTRPSTAAGHRLTGAADLVARVAVCAPDMLEDKCKSYYDRASPAEETVKPIGLLQQYGDIDVDRRIRFGLMTGSYKKNTSGGVLRKDIGLLANNDGTDSASASICGDNDPRDEIDVCTGQFINQETGDTGIIDSLNRIHIAGYKTPASGAITSTQVCTAGYNNSAPFACNAGNLLSGTNGTCVDWGNPLSEMYHEALRYFAGKTSATAAYAVDDGAATAVITGLGQDTWNNGSDPLPATEWCALSNIILLSTGLSSLDNAAITTDIAGLNATTLTNAVGSAEGIDGGSFLIGSNGTISDNVCSEKVLPNLSSASGICPEVPHMKGGYLIAGLASANRTLDLRPGYATNRATRWTGINADWVARQPVGNYMVSLAENLPSFEIPVGNGKVTLVPACGSGGSAPYTVCSMTDLRVESYTADSGSFLVSWEDNSAGSDYDMDTIARIAYCVGTACNTPGFGNAGVGTDRIKIVVSAAQSATGATMNLGYTVSGTSSDGTVYPVRLPGTATCNPTDCGAGSANRNFFSLLTTPSSWRCTNSSTWTACPAGTSPLPDGTIPKLPDGIRTAGGCPSGANCGCPKATVYTQSSTPSGLLKNPLWYAAKYGAPASSWDLQNNTTGAQTPDGDPDNFFDVRNPSVLYEALSKVFDRAAQPDAAASSVATNSTNLQIGSRVFQARFSGVDWSGQLLSYRIDTAGVLATVEEWDAGAKINAQNPTTGRTILTRGSSDGVAFAYGDLTPTQQSSLDQDWTAATDDCGADRVGYLRGSDAREGSVGTFTNGTCETSMFRERLTSKLGDTVNSNPWYVGAPSAGYSDADYPGYNAFLTANLSRKPVVYVGANDGMLHGFDASLVFDPTNPNDPGVPTSTAGNEVLGYIPTAVIPNLTRLTAQNYNQNHRYFVDGSPMTADADLDASSTDAWRTVLVGGLGGGGKGYYALDVSNPAGFSEAGTAPATISLWEFDETDMGYAYNLPPVSSRTKQAKQIVRVCTAGSNPCTAGKWAVVLGNGYNSVVGKAVLYVVFIEEGLDGSWAAGDFVKIVAEAPVAPATNADNGLSTPVPFDSNGDGYADTVYAGDLKGHLWKFLIGPNASDAGITGVSSTWKVAFSSAGCETTTTGCNALFQAKDSGGTPQPIVSPPEVVLHPVTGQMVLFGTGKYLEGSDNTSAQTQSFYGIWDKHDGSTTVGLRSTDLLQQTVTTVQTLTGGNYRIVSDNPITWREAGGAAANCTSPCTPTHMGWYLDLPTSKERVTGIPQVVRRLVFFNTFIPSEQPCDAGGTGWLMVLDWRTGGLPSNRVFDTNGSGVIDSTDTAAGGYQVGGALGGTTLIPGQTGSVGVGVSSLTSGRLVSTLINFGSSRWERFNWREIVQ